MQNDLEQQNDPGKKGANDKRPEKNGETAGKKPAASLENENEHKNKNELERGLSSDYLKDLDNQLKLEEEIINDCAKKESGYLQEALLNLKKASEESLKNLSAKTVEIFNSNRLVVRLRDIYVEKRSKRIDQELSVPMSWQKAEDYDNFLKLAESDFWGTSKNASNAVFRVHRALLSISQRFPEKNEEIARLWPKIFSRPNHGSENDYITFLGGYLEKELKKFLEKKPDYADNPAKNPEFIKNCEDFLALSCLHISDFYSKEIDGQAEIEKRLDSIIAKYPGLKKIPGANIETLLENFAIEFPEKILADSRRVNFFFNLWLADCKNKSDRKLQILPLFADRIKNCSPEESQQILENLLYYWPDNENRRWVINPLPLEKKQFNWLAKKYKNVVDDPLLTLKIKEAKNTGAGADRAEKLLAEAEQLSNDNGLIFVTNLITNYSPAGGKIDETSLETIIDAFIKKNPKCFNINSLRALAALMKRYYWPDNLQKKIFSSNHLNNTNLNSIMTDAEPEKYGWISENLILNSQLQLDFHKRGQANDLRHYFYEVLDGRKKTDNFDDLIKSYARSAEEMDFEELKNLFLNNRLDRKYLPDYIKQVRATSILSGLENDNGVKVDDKFWLLETALSHGQAKGCTIILEKLLTDKEVDDPEERKRLIDVMLTNVFAKINSDPDFNRIREAIHTDISPSLIRDQQPRFLTEAENQYLGQEALKQSLDIEQDSLTTIMALFQPSKIKDYFPKEAERKAYLEKLFNKLIVNIINNQDFPRIVKAYFSNPDLVEVLDHEYRLDLEEKIFTKTISRDPCNLLGLLNKMTADQKNKFITSFERDLDMSILTGNVYTHMAVFQPICQNWLICVLNYQALPWKNG